METNDYYNLGAKLATAELRFKHNTRKQAAEEGLPWWAYPAIGAGAGLGAYGLARVPMLASASKYPILRRIQEMAKGKMYRAGIRSQPTDPTKAQKAVRSVVHGPEIEKGIEQLPKGVKGTKEAPTAVWSGGGTPMKGSFDPSLGPVTGREAAKADELVGMLEDKLIEAQMLQKFAPGTLPRTVALADMLKKYKLTLRGGQHTEQELARLQEALSKEFGGTEYLIKTRGASEQLGGDLGAASSGSFPTGKTDLYRAQKDWEKMQPEFHEAWAEASDPNKAIGAFRKRPGYEGRVVPEIYGDNVIIQERVPLKQFKGRTAAKMEERGLSPTEEHRVHVVGGRAVPSLAMPRYYGNPFQAIMQTLKARRAAKWLQKEVVDKLPQNVKGLSYGMDVAPVAGGKGYKVIETNPGGLSGLLDMPVTGNPMLHRAVTGRHTKPIAAALGVGAGLAGAGTAAAAT